MNKTQRLFKLKDHLFHIQAVTTPAANTGNSAIHFRLKDIFHFHGLNHSQFLAGLDVLSLFDL